eukprot:2288161-Rhodomonas_salina.2
MPGQVRGREVSQAHTGTRGKHADRDFSLCSSKTAWEKGIGSSRSNKSHLLNHDVVDSVHKVPLLNPWVVVLIIRTLQAIHTQDVMGGDLGDGDSDSPKPDLRPGLFERQNFRSRRQGHPAGGSKVLHTCVLAKDARRLKLESTKAPWSQRICVRVAHCTTTASTGTRYT